MKYYIIRYNNRPLGFSGESCKSKFDLLDACIDCGTGARLIGNLKVKGFSNIKKDFFETLSGDFIISKRLYSQIRVNVNDLKLKQIVDSRNRYLDYYHFTSNASLPKFKNGSTGFVIECQCQTCKRNGYFSDTKIGDPKKNVPTIIHPYIFKYDKNDLEESKNELILKTWECFGLSRRIATGIYVIRYARPLIIVSEKIKEIFIKEKIKDIEYEQIIIE